MAALLITIFSIVTIIAFVVTIRATISVGGKKRHILWLKLSLMLFAGIRNSVISQNGFCVSTISRNQFILFLEVQIF